MVVSVQVQELLKTLGKANEATRQSLERISRLKPLVSSKNKKAGGLPSPILMACKTSHALCETFALAVRRIAVTKSRTLPFGSMITDPTQPVFNMIYTGLSSKIILSAHVNQIADRHLVQLCGEKVLKGLHISGTGTDSSIYQHFDPLVGPCDRSAAGQKELLNTEKLTPDNLRACLDTVDRMCHAFVQESLNIFDTTRFLFPNDPLLHDNLDDYAERMMTTYAKFYTSNHAYLTRKHLRPFKPLVLDNS